MLIFLKIVRTYAVLESKGCERLRPEALRLFENKNFKDIKQSNFVCQISVGHAVHRSKNKMGTKSAGNTAGREFINNNRNFGQQSRPSLRERNSFFGTSGLSNKPLVDSF